MRDHNQPNSLRHTLLARVLAFIAALTASVAVASSDESLALLLSAFAQHPHARARFAEQTYSRVLKHPLHATGELYFDAPDRLEKKTLTPAPVDLLVEGENVTVTRGTHRHSFLIGDYPPLRPLLEGLRATLAGDLAGLTARFSVIAEQKGEDWLLTLQPLPSDIQPLYQRIQIRGREGRVRSVQIERENGERSLMTIDAAESP
jgi:hypothetical protein